MAQNVYTESRSQMIDFTRFTFEVSWRWPSTCITCTLPRYPSLPIFQNDRILALAQARFALVVRWGYYARLELCASLAPAPTACR